MIRRPPSNITRIRVDTRFDPWALVTGLASALQPRRTPMRLRAVFCSAAAAVFMFAVNCSCLAASPDAAEAKALLDKAVAYFDSNGVARAFCAFNDTNGAFHKGPLYVFAI